MTPDEWGRLRDLFTAAQDLPAAERSAFLSRECLGNGSLEREARRLLDLAARAGDFLDHPACQLAPPASSTLFAAGELVAGRFLIVRFLGRGGMGEVYEARDSLLGIVVALKAMNPEAGAVQRMTERFRREVHLARQVSHASVCRVHDVALHRAASGDVIVLTMELLTGETLADRLRRGPLLEVEALAIARPLAEALDAAHEARVLHRDVKPSNIFLDRQNGSSRPVLTDFGVARAMEPTESDATQAGFLIGTPAYLAPEQLTGGAAARESDLYAFALVLYEMLAGRRPYETLPERLAGPPRRPGHGVPLPPAWKEALDRALSPEPAARFKSATELVNALVSGAGARRSRRGHGGAVAAMAIVLTATALALTAPLFRFTSRGDPVVPSTAPVLLTALANDTGDPQFDGAGEVLRSQLAQSPRFELLPTERVVATLARMHQNGAGRLSAEIAREVALREGAALVIYPTLTRGDGYTLTVRLERVGSRPLLVAGRWQQTFRAPSSNDLFEAIHAASGWVRDTIGESADSRSEQDRVPAETTTSSWEALRLFSKSEALAGAGRTTQALILLDEAVRLDPAFAMAHMRRADLLIALKRDRDGYAAWKTAVDLAERTQLTTREQLRITGQYYEDTGDLPRAEAAYRAYALHYPDDSRAAFFVGSILVDRGRSAEAVPWLAKAAALAPNGYVAQIHLATAQLDSGHPDEARQIAASLRARGIAGWAAWIEALDRFAAGDLPGALHSIDALPTGGDAAWVSRAASLRAAWLVELDDLDGATSALEAGIQSDAAAGLTDRLADKWLALAEVKRRLRDRAGAIDAARRGLAVASNAVRTMTAGGIFSAMGDAAGAQASLRALDQEPDVPRVRYARYRLEGELALRAGRAADAVAPLRRAMQLAPVYRLQLSYAEALHRLGRTGEAAAVLADFIDHPVRAYLAIDGEPPGIWRDAVAEYVHLIRESHPSNAAVLLERLQPWQAGLRPRRPAAAIH